LTALILVSSRLILLDFLQNNGYNIYSSQRKFCEKFYKTVLSNSAKDTEIEQRNAITQIAQLAKKVANAAEIKAFCAF